MLLPPDEFDTFISEVDVLCITFSANLRSEKLRKLDALKAKHGSNHSPQSLEPTRQQINPIFHPRVVNTTNIVFTSEEEDLLSKGLKHCLPL